MEERELGSDTGTSFGIDTTQVHGSDPPEDRSQRRWIPLPGSVIAGRYRIESVIGEGGMGAVVAATHIGLGERIALKFLHPRLSDDKDSSARFLREAQASARIRSDHVVRVTDVGATEQGLPFIAMELLHGEDLESAVSHGPFPLLTAVDCVLEAAEALAEAHAVGIVHRDIKPANLWLTPQSDGTQHLKVLDFGISKVSKSADAKATAGALTQTQSVFGSPTYMSPEQIRSAKHVDFKTDVWSLGIVLFELLTRRRPFDGETVSAVLAAIAADMPSSVQHYDPRIPDSIDLAIAACLEKDPSRRISLAELAERLRPYASPQGQRAADRVLSLRPSASVIAPQESGSFPPRKVAVAVTGTRATTGPRPAQPRSHRTQLVIAVAIMIVGIGALGTALVVRRGTTETAVRAAPSAVTAAAPPIVSDLPPVKADATTPPPPTTMTTTTASATASAHAPRRPAAAPRASAPAPAPSPTPAPSAPAPSPTPKPPATVFSPDRQ